MTYDELNDLTHDVADVLSHYGVVLERSYDLYDLNDILTAFLSNRGISFTEGNNG